ncbi:MAG: metallophosphoesterase family protein [Candidatus Cryptobacteroides sp.]|nr:metallophosphoesterase family protein [Candidatus Cryptobacteroides sp.]
MYVGIISDTHGVFSDEFKNFLAPVDVIWHAGDFGGGIDFVHSISAFKPLIGVYGNCDAQEIRYECPLTQLFNCEGLKVLMTHIGGYPGHYPLNVAAMIDRHRPDIFVCGHSHILKVMRDPRYNLLDINPGAAGLQGWQTVRTALRMRIDDGKPYDLEVFELPR